MFTISTAGEIQWVGQAVKAELSGDIADISAVYSENQVVVVSGVQNSDKIAAVAFEISQDENKKITLTRKATQEINIIGELYKTPEYFDTYGLKLDCEF